MAKGEVGTVKDAVHRLQLCLLEGIADENKLFAAGALISKGDYQDVVTERSLANLCGYPICGNSLPLERPRKGRYRISLKEHKVYDLHETYLYCSTSCLINSRAFGANLQEERSSSLNPAKLNEVLRLFEGLNLEDSKEDVGKKSNSGLSALRIQEKTDTRAGEVDLEEWIGPSNSIEGYVPQRDFNLSQQLPDKLDKGHKSKNTQVHPEKENFFGEMDFTSTVIFQDEYSILKPPDTANSKSGEKSKVNKGKMKQKSLKHHSANLEPQADSVGCNTHNKKSPKAQSRLVMNEKLSDLSKDMYEKLVIADSPSDNGRSASVEDTSEAASGSHGGEVSVLNSAALKSSIKSSTGKRGTRSVTWADEKTDGNSWRGLCEISDLEDKKATSRRADTTEMEVAEEYSYRFVSAEALSEVLFQDEYSISKPPDTTNSKSGEKSKLHKGKMKQKCLKHHSVNSEPQADSVGCDIQNKKSPKAQTRLVMNEKLSDLSKDMNEKLSIVNLSSDHGRSACIEDTSEVASGSHGGEVSVLHSTAVKSSIKSSTGKRGTRSVIWADEKNDGNSSRSLCEITELEDENATSRRAGTTETEVGEGDSYRFVSAEACAKALSDAAEAAASGDSDISNAMSEAEIIVLPPPQEADISNALENFDMLDSDPNFLKWPMKSSSSNSNLFDSSDSWYDDPPEGFNLTLSPFAMMFMALFAWTSSSSLAFVYGHDESHHEDYLCVNGREYPRRIFASDGRSLEIMQALSGCLTRALPGLVTDLRISVPLSTMEKEMDLLLDTMSFMDPLPPFRMKQWQLLVLLFLDALSVCRIPALTTYMTGRRILLPKVFQGAQISSEEYEVMKDLMIPLGRVPQFAMQSGA